MAPLVNDCVATDTLLAAVVIQPQEHWPVKVEELCLVCLGSAHYFL